MEIVSLGLVALVLVFFGLGIKIVPQSQNFVVERLGRFSRTLEAGLHVIIPVIESVRHRVDILERQLPTSKISTITFDATGDIPLAGGATALRSQDKETLIYLNSDGLEHDMKRCK